MGWNGAERDKQQCRAASSHNGWMPEGRHGYSDEFKPSYYGHRAFRWQWRPYQLLEYRGNVRPRPLIVIFNATTAVGSKLHPGAGTTNSCCYGCGGSCGRHVYAIIVLISVPTHLSASRDAGIQGRLSEFVSTRILMSVNILCGLSDDTDAASVADYIAQILECDSFFFKC